MLIRLFPFLLTFIQLSLACHPQFEKELRYLDLYLGIRPADDGVLPVREPEEFASYIDDSSLLNCDFDGDCLWKNAESDSLLDTSDWWLFEKSDDKPFPAQIQPGNPIIPVENRLIVAGNTSTTAESAVLVSAPVACQHSTGNLTFNYWLYNNAKIEVVIVRATNRRTHLQALSRPSMNCHFLRPANEACSVAIPPIDEPFRIAIRAFNLKDNVVGSMALIGNITYSAHTCGESPFPKVFSSLKLPVKEEFQLTSMSDLNCVRPKRKCAWENRISSLSEWKIGRSLDKWNYLMEAGPNDDKPNSTFVFLVVDSLSPRPYSMLRSHLVPCTQQMTTLTFRYWMKAGTQVEVCAVDEDGIQLSCAYLTETDIPGPISVDVDAYSKPFRFTFEIIAFDETSVGLIALSDIRVSGLLCSQEAPPVTTTIDPPTIVSMFGLQRGPGYRVPYELTLNCDFSKDYCSQWVNDDGLVAYGTAPKNTREFPMPRDIKGNVALFLLKNKTNSILRSREVPCAHNGEISVHFMRSERGSVSLCAFDKCVFSNQTYGVLTMALDSVEPFEITIEASSSGPAIVVVNSISVTGDICQLRTVPQLACDKLQCGFKDSFCSYSTPIEMPGDAHLQISSQGASITLTEEKKRAVLLSPQFDLPHPVDLYLQVSQSTFGSRLLICPDVASNSDACHELLGPRVTTSTTHEINFALDAAARQFAIVLIHEHAAEFGDAHFEVHNIDIRDHNANSICV